MTTADSSDHAVVDAHHHLWDIDRGYDWLDAPELAAIRRTFTTDDLAAELAAHRVDATVLVEAGRCRTDEVAAHLAAAHRTPAIAGVVAWADLTDPDLAGTLAAYRKLPGADKLVGVRDQLQGRTEPGFLARDDVRANLATVAAAGLAVDLVVRVDQLTDCAAAAAALPDARFVLDHLGKPRIAAGGYDEWRAALAPLAAHPNVTAKLSGLVTEAGPGWTADDLRPYVVAAVELFGAGRLMYGSDWPVCTAVADYGRVLAALRATLPDHVDTAAVLGGTAAATYRLEMP